MKKENSNKKLVTLESIDAKIDAALASIDTKIDTILAFVDGKIDYLTVITAKSFEGMHAEMNKLETSLNQKIDYRFDALSNRIDDLVLNKVSYEAHNLLVKRVTTLEKKAGS